MNATFARKYDWALVPERRHIERGMPKEDAAHYADGFRWIRKTRTAGACWPWLAAQELGWIIQSPVDIVMTPIHDIELACDPEDFEAISRTTHLSELWKRGENFLALPPNNWLRLYDIRTLNGFESMFVPNGEGTIEWHLGWEASIPDGYFLLVMSDHETPANLDVPMGLLDARTVRKLNDKQGMAIAVKPTQTVHICRRQTVARLLLLHPDSIKH